MSYVNDTQLNYFAQQFWTKCKGSFDALGSADQALVNAKTYADGLNTAMDTRMTAVETDVAVLKGDENTVGSVAYQIAEIVAGADASFDTLKEIADWIMNDTIGATQMANDIEALKTSVYGVETSANVVVKDTNGVNPDYVFNADDKFMVDGVETTFANQTDFDNAVANATDVELIKTEMVGGLINDVEANEEAIANLVEFIGELPEGATADTVLGYMQEYVQAQLEASDLSQYAKAEDLEALEEVVGVPSTDDGQGNVSPATGMMAKMEAVEEKAQANEDAIGVLNGDETVEGSVAKAVKDAKDAVDADIEALSEAVNETIEALDERVTANENAIAELEAKKDIYVDADADNKYNAETGKVELFLNDEGEYEQVILSWAVSGICKLPSFAKFVQSDADAQLYQTTIDGQGVDVTTEEQFYECLTTTGVYADCYPWENAVPNLTTYYTSNGDGTYTKVDVAEGDSIGHEVANAITRDGKEVFVKKESTKIEVDMSGLDAKIEANVDAIAVLNGDADTEGSVAKAIADASSSIANDMSELEARVEANEIAIGTETVDDGQGNVTPATGIYARLEALETPISNDDIDNIINGLM